MTVEQFRTAMTRRPFIPFVIHLADGDRLPVRHPEHIAMSPGGRTVFVFGEGEACSIVDLLLVTRLDVESPLLSPSPQT
jgi:hypothetical protein